MADDQKPPNGNKTPVCPICKGIGFLNGNICTCITGKNANVPPEIWKIFEPIFGADFYENR